MTEINLLKNYPKTNRNLSEASEQRTDEVRKVARKFDKEFFDGDRKYGYGGYNYNPRFWTNVVKDFVKYYNLIDGSKILDVGCGKGFMVYDFLKYNNKFNVMGIDISEYAIENSMPDVKDYLKIGDAKRLEFEDNYFDLVISINTLHNLYSYDLMKSLKEIERVGKNNKYICVESYRNEEEKANLLYWQVTCEAFNTPKEWQWWFRESGYTGDYSFIYFE